MTEPHHLVFRVVFYQHGSEWYGHCLDCDVVSSGKTEKDAANAVAEALEALIEESFRSGDLSPLFAPAPLEFWDMYAKSARHLPPRQLDANVEEGGGAEILSAAVA